jgi:hypothetical protein
MHLLITPVMARRDVTHLTIAVHFTLQAFKPVIILQTKRSYKILQNLAEHTVNVMLFTIIVKLLPTSAQAKCFVY